MKTITTNHELDGMFDVDPGKTEITIPGKPTNVVTVEPIEDAQPVSAEDLYDSKDREIESQIGDVYERAIEAHETQMVAAQTVVDKKFAPRNAEIGADFLRIALEALKEKNAIKDRKDKIVAKGPAKTPEQKPGITNNIVTDRTTLLRMLRNQQND